MVVAADGQAGTERASRLKSKTAAALLLLPRIKKLHSIDGRCDVRHINIIIVLPLLKFRYILSRE